MKLHEIADAINAEILTHGENPEIDIHLACGSDLMSDVMAYVDGSDFLLLTGLLNLQVVRTAEMMDIRAIVFVRGKKPGANIIEMAKERGIAVMSTKHPMFVACGKLYDAGIVGRCVKN
jgi:predicted transcriptional regulator